MAGKRRFADWEGARGLRAWRDVGDVGCWMGKGRWEMLLYGGFGVPVSFACTQIRYWGVGLSGFAK